MKEQADPIRRVKRYYGYERPIKALRTLNVLDFAEPSAANRLHTTLAHRGKLKRVVDCSWVFV